MPKVTLDLNAFKALASETRLDILRTLDGKKLSLNDISATTKLHKVTLHEHLTKLNEAGLIKRKERKGHKWVYYKLSWKGESLLHPENTRVVVLFSATFITMFFGIVGMFNFVKETMALSRQSDMIIDDGGGPIKGPLPPGASEMASSQDPTLLYIAIGCLLLFTILMTISLWRFKRNIKPRL